MLENWSSTGTLNRAIDLHPAYHAPRARLESVQARPMARVKGITRGRLPTLAEREGADRKSRDRRGTLSHGRTREGGKTMPEERKSISPPSDEGEANEHTDAAATTPGMRETQGTPVRQRPGSEMPQSANGKHANRRAERRRPPVELSDAEADSRATLMKDWTCYQWSLVRQERAKLASVQAAQKRALRLLSDTSPRLYLAAIQPCLGANGDLPIRFAGPYATPPLPTDLYEAPDGERVDTTHTFDYEFQLDRKFIVDAKKSKFVLIKGISVPKAVDS
nr:unnamed protein product [Spirometra erinaceieuropaei]